MRGFRISLARGLLAAALAVTVGCISEKAANRISPDDYRVTENSAPVVMPEIVVSAPAFEPPVMDTVVITAERDADVGAASRIEPQAGPKAVSGAGSSMSAGRKLVEGHAPGPQPGMANSDFPFNPQRIEP